jgi:hypothetical protein
MSNNTTYSEFMNHVNSRSKFSYKQAMLVKKIDLSENPKLRSQIDRVFTDPDKYLDLSAKENGMVIGKVLKFPKLDHKGNIKIHTVVGSPDMFARRNTLNGGALRKGASWKDSGKNVLLHVPSIYREKKEKPTELITEGRLGEIYDKFKRLKKLNETKMNEFIDEVGGEPVCRAEMKSRLLQQEKCLLKTQENNKKKEDMIKIISRCTNKKNEEILMNQTDSFRLKKEINNIIDSKKSIEEKYGSNYWMLNLRRSKNTKGPREAWVNVGSNKTPHWTLLKEKSTEDATEKIRKPEGTVFKEFFSLSKSNSFLNKTMRNLKINLDDSEQLKNMTVQLFIFFTNLFNI